MDNPKAKLKLSDPVHLLATGFASGLAPIAPGTAGSLAAIPFWLLFVHYLPWIWCLSILAVSALVGIYICHRTAKDMGEHDHGSIVWDEFVGMWITLLVVPVLNWQWVLLAFILFRFFDMLKPWPISWFDRNVHGGFGIMIDDVIAGAISAVILFLLAQYAPMGFMF